MDQKKIHAIIVGVVLMGVGAGLYYIWQKNQTTTPAVAATPATPAKTS